MKASELIKALQEQIDKHGDIEVWQASPETVIIDGVTYNPATSYNDEYFVLTGYSGI